MPTPEKSTIQRRSLVSWLFWARCCIAWLPIAAMHAYEQKPIGLAALALYVVGIPLLLALYDRLVLKK